MEGASVVHNQIAVKNNINISPQETAVAPNLTVVENLRLMARLYGYSKIQAEQCAIAQMNIFGLLTRQHEKAKTLSGGYKRRLSVAMAMMSTPKILFLDEPTLGMDVRARRDLWSILRQLKGHVTIVLTTHYLEEVEVLADRVGIMHNGKLRALGTIQQLMSQTGKPTFEDVFFRADRGGVTLKAVIFATRNHKEIVRDPLTLLFGIAFPVLMMVLFSVMQKKYAICII